MKVSHRLRQLDNMITNHYRHIWDCCCDHGLLGMLLLDRCAADTIHFVDIEPDLMVQLENTLTQFFPNDVQNSRWQTQTLDVSKLSLPDDEPQLIIISGIGGKLTAELVTAIRLSHPDKSLEFLLCSVHHQYELRTKLHELGLRLITEKLLQDNKRFYELIHVGTSVDTNISPVGSVLWADSQTDSQQYLQRTLEHYQRKLRGLGDQSERRKTEEIISAYDHLITRI